MSMAPDFLSTHAEACTQALHRMLDSHCPSVPEPLLSAMRYALMAGGKRIRPALLMECFYACGGQQNETAWQTAIAVECIHTYSLIHDDLPCMDDDDWRRGMPSCHRRFDEATAVLAGDALQALAFELIAAANKDHAVRCELIHKLAVAVGGQGMVGGQVLDMQAAADDIHHILDVERIHIHKTGALIRFCCEAGTLLTAATPEQRQACAHFGAAVGLLFQIADDIMDATASRQQMGKTAGKDEAQGKATYITTVGLKEASRMAENLCETACAAAEELGSAGDNLAALARYILRRQV